MGEGQMGQGKGGTREKWGIGGQDTKIGQHKTTKAEQKRGEIKVEESKIFKMGDRRG
jgi:hypothetical protein